MELSEAEINIINTIRQTKRNAKNKEALILFKYVPVGENEYIEQILPGHAKSIFSIRLQMKKLLDDFIATGQPSGIFTIDYEPGLIRIFQH